MPADLARWSATPFSYSSAERIARDLGLSPVTAEVLVRRGHDTPEAARLFLDGADRHEPLAMHDMGRARDLILGHVQAGSEIVVHGDYDVDGVASTAVLVRALRALGAQPRWHLPSRSEDGYGLSLTTVERLAAEGTKLLVTVDCAVTACDEVARARELGIDVVVTDHHRPGEQLPDCPVVHPALGRYPFAELCATGVAHKVAEALFATAGLDPRSLERDLDLVALATVADLVPLVGENRRLVREGLVQMARTEKPGLRALMSVARLDPGQLDSHALGFRLSPRLNAAGRLQRADAALELLLTEDEERAAEVADELDLLNRERRDTETRIMFAAEAARAEHPEAPAYVLAGEGWHSGVIGIVASRMVERYHRPVLMVALDGDGGRGSGRSIAPFDLHAGLAACSAHLRRFGGHRAAAGFEIDAMAVEPLREAFVAHAASVLSPGDLVPLERVDAVVPGTAVTLDLAEELERLGPFGQGNPVPSLLVPAARIGDVRAMGHEGEHARCTLTTGGARARAVAFRTPSRELASHGDELRDVVARLELNRWNGTLEERLCVRGVCRTETGAVQVLGEDGNFWEAFEREYGVDPVNPPAPECGPALRALVRREGEGFAGVAGALLAAGESVLVVCADVARRRSGVESVVGGLSRGSSMAPGLVSWQALAERPELAAPYDHVVALDPPVMPWGAALLASLPAAGVSGYAHLAWGAAEREFALRVAEHELDLRAGMASLWRSLRDCGGEAAGDALVSLLRGDGRHPQSPLVAARMIRVMGELELAVLEPDGDGYTCRLLEGARTDITRAPAARAYGDRLVRIRRLLGAATPETPAQPAVA
ncbi:MAG: single-stranded-DNA-specific exonuclease RecJ [Thermoleophilaceae bacterium]